MWERMVPSGNERFFQQSVARPLNPPRFAEQPRNLAQRLSITEGYADSRSHRRGLGNLVRRSHWCTDDRSRLSDRSFTKPSFICDQINMGSESSRINKLGWDGQISMKGWIFFGAKAFSLCDLIPVIPTGLPVNQKRSRNSGRPKWA